MAELLITLSDGRQLRRTLGSVPHVVGRDATCDTPLDDPSTSRRHARFTPTPEGYVVEDMGSKNGTLVNGAPCSSQLLRDGDQILAGAVSIVFKDSATTSAPVVVDDDLSGSRATHYVSRTRQLSLPQRRLEMLYELSERLTTLQGRDGLLEEALGICFETLRFERGVVGVRRRDGRTLEWPVVRNLRGAEGELTISRTVLNRALEYGERSLFTDGDPGVADPTVSMVQQGIRSAMCVPLMHGDDVLGVIYGDRTSTSASYTNEDIDFLAGIARHVSIGLINCRLVEEQKQAIRLRHDVDVARRIQTGLFPASLPRRDDLTVAAINDPGARVSGDYYDVIDAGGGRVWLLVADVTGEGVPAALLMANLQATVRVTIGDGDDPATLLARWNRLVWTNTDSAQFITCLLALVDPATRSIRLATAGHQLPVIVTAGGAAPAESAGGGYPLGVVEDATFTTTTIPGVGDAPFVFFAYTDGVTEAANADRELFGTDRLMALLDASRDLGPGALVTKVRKAVAGFAGGAAQSDDITMLAARVG